jgi:uncharacterized membrane protein YedE/YeeE
MTAVVTEFTPVMSLIGGGLIGLASVGLLALTGRIAGVSGIVSRLLPPVSRGSGVGYAFVIGLLTAPLVYQLATGDLPSQSVSSNLPMLAIAGLLVGFGTVVGSGCTSGHGVCGLSRLSQRSLIATCIFMIFGFATVYLLRHAMGV